jgi:hypothetical protein
LRFIYGYGGRVNMENQQPAKAEAQKTTILSSFEVVQKCGDCGESDTSPPKDVLGRKLPYGGGLVGCSAHGVGYYPFKINTCSDFYKKQ